MTIVGRGDLSGGDAGPEWLAELASIRADLGELEALERKIETLQAVLQDLLPPEQFRLVWELQDAEETLRLAEAAMRERQLSAGGGPWGGRPGQSPAGTR